MCYYPRPTRTGRIELSFHFIERSSDVEVLDTILHEIAYALVDPKHGQDATWKATCSEIGARPRRCFDRSVDMAGNVPLLPHGVRPAPAAATAGRVVLPDVWSGEGAG